MAGLNFGGQVSRYDARTKELGIKRSPVGYHRTVQFLPVIFAAGFAFLAIRALNFPSTEGALPGLQPPSILSAAWRWFAAVLSPIVGVVSLIVGIVSIALAVRATRQAKRADNVLDETRDLARNAQGVLADIRASVPTRFIGSFPEYLHEIRELVEHANEEILIMADCVDNGAFANPRLHKDVLDALQKAVMKEVKITYLVWGEGGPAHLSRANRWRFTKVDEWIADAEFCNCLKNWMESQHIPAAYLDISDKNSFGANFERLLLAAHDDVARTLLSVESPGKQRITILQTKSEPNFFLWVSDKNKAVFLIPNERGSAHAAAFHTQDRTFVEMLRLTFSAYCNHQDTCPYKPKAQSVADEVRRITDGGH